MRRKIPENRPFSAAMRSMREALGLGQRAMAARLGTSKRTLSDWENGYNLPKPTQRVHFLYTVHEVADAHTQTFAEVLGITHHPAVQPLLADDEPEEPAPVVAPPPPAPPPPLPVVEQPEAPPPAPPPPPPRPSREELRAALDLAVREAADLADVRASDLRRGAYALLGAIVEVGCSLEEAMGALEGSALRKVRVGAAAAVKRSSA
jgi:transcriptional regulator with XRE-family HTH domain